MDDSGIRGTTFARSAWALWPKPCEIEHGLAGWPRSTSGHHHDFTRAPHISKRVGRPGVFPQTRAQLDCGFCFDRALRPVPEAPSRAASRSARSPGRAKKARTPPLEAGAFSEAPGNRELRRHVGRGGPRPAGTPSTSMCDLRRGVPRITVLRIRGGRRRMDVVDHRS